MALSFAAFFLLASADPAHGQNLLANPSCTSTVSDSEGGDSQDDVAEWTEPPLPTDNDWSCKAPSNESISPYSFGAQDGDGGLFSAYLEASGTGT